MAVISHTKQHEIKVRPRVSRRRRENAKQTFIFACASLGIRMLTRHRVDMIGRNVERTEECSIGQIEIAFRMIAGDPAFITKEEPRARPIASFGERRGRQPVIQLLRSPAARQGYEEATPFVNRLPAQLMNQRRRLGGPF